MGSIKATFSAVDVYASNCSNDYVAMINTANEILTRVEKLHTDVQEDYEKISKQIVRLQIMREEVATKVKSYEHKMNEAAAEAERWQAEIDYLYSHPDTVTSTDEDGNETTEEVYDYAAISAAERKRDDAMEIYYLYREKYEAAYSVLVETENTQSRFETIKNAIHAVGESIQSDIYEIKKYISAIGDEAEHNTRSLQGVLGSLSTYLASKAIFMPAGAIYEDFASSGGSNATIQSNNHSDITVENKSVPPFDAFELSFENLPDDVSSNTLNSIMYDATARTKTVSHRRFEKQSKKDVKNLNYIERRAIDNYCSDNGFPPIYEQINSYLRGKSTEIPSYLKDDINAMTEAISQRTLTQSTTVYRALKSSQSIFKGNENLSVEELNQLFVGQDYIDRGFCSTSISEKGIEEFLSWNGVILEIEAPAGAQAIFTGEVSRYKEKEQEILFQRGSIFRINSISEANGIKRVNLTLTGRLPL